jgi:hypothetical protein
VCVCVCVRERVRQRERQRGEAEQLRSMFHGKWILAFLSCNRRPHKQNSDFKLNCSWSQLDTGGLNKPRASIEVEIFLLSVLEPWPKQSYIVVVVKVTWARDTFERRGKPSEVEMSYGNFTELKKPDLSIWPPTLLKKITQHELSNVDWKLRKADFLRAKILANKTLVFFVCLPLTTQLFWIRTQFIKFLFVYNPSCDKLPIWLVHYIFI